MIFELGIRNRLLNTKNKKIKLDMYRKDIQHLKTIFLHGLIKKLYINFKKYIF